MYGNTRTSQTRGQQGRNVSLQNQLSSRAPPPPPPPQQQAKVIYHQTKPQQHATQMMQGTQQGVRGQQVMGQQQAMDQPHYQTQQQQVKQEALVAQIPNPDVVMDGETVKPKWMKKRNPLNKVSNRVKRKKLNLRMRKVIQPKSPFVVLNELKPNTTYRSADVGMQYLGSGMFTVICEVDGKDIKGQGITKELAKQAAAENAIKSVIGERVKQEKLARIAKSNGDGGEKMDTGNDDEEEVPWCTLASFAMYKLLAEWTEERDPAVIEYIPDLMSVTASASQGNGTVAKGDGVIRPMKKPIENPTERHPVALLYNLKPGTVYVTNQESSQPGNIMFLAETTVDGVKFTGRGRNKKEAKKSCAKAVLEKLYNIVYPPESQN